ncbi:MAG TPA: hypothetical protein HA292_04425 [Candidatus Nitrosotenuis sp.]|nr:hypothetical protein [Candidatus Nitrosotenuis sp.]HIH68281.1 hypothetical protein [Candidatus Nitrosotenuis sp.]HII03528.1 hypothetical protein [Candidatus Nitrosotenuis sp.]
MEGFIEKIDHMRKTLVMVSLSSLILAPLAIGLSVYLISHPHFFYVMEEYDEFGLFLVVSLGVIIVVSSAWLALGIRQYIMLKSWSERHSNYLKKKEQVDNEISSGFGLDKDEQS